MLIIITLVSLAVFLYGCYDCKQSNGWNFGFQLLGGIFLIISILVFIFIGYSYSQKIVIDERIIMYQEENQYIESEISNIVKNYQGYEKEVFENCKNESPVTLITMFPELKSNELVNKQIEVYLNNNNIIKQLKEKKLQFKVEAWWLFFGSK